jgi:hypothetical protein
MKKPRMYNRVEVYRPLHRESYYTDGSAYQKLEFCFRSSEFFRPALKVCFQRHRNADTWSEWYGGTLEIGATCVRDVRKLATFANRLNIHSPEELMSTLPGYIEVVLPRLPEYFNPNFRG